MKARTPKIALAIAATALLTPGCRKRPETGAGPQLTPPPAASNTAGQVRPVAPPYSGQQSGQTNTAATNSATSPATTTQPPAKKPVLLTD